MEPWVYLLYFEAELLPFEALCAYAAIGLRCLLAGMFCWLVSAVAPLDATLPMVFLVDLGL